ncbi:MAG: hypothetical protein HYV27_17875 [Candidatus Hydrogenedentes bacterium]|nr:hypothetical protein [Candidatus Hydrogenedentota bacterium]
MAVPPKSGIELTDPRQIIRWSRQYAKSRTISFLVQWVIIVLMVLVVGAAGSLTNMAYQAHNMGLVILSVVLMGFMIMVLTWFSLSRWGSEVIAKITDWLYGEEGYVEYSGDRREGPAPLWLTALSGGLVVHHLVGAMLFSFAYMPLKMMQPFSACYMTPFLVMLILYQRLGLWAWIWPTLYGLHAVLLVMGFPIGFKGQWQLLNMVVPVLGYGFIAIMAGHLYSRFALYKLRQVAQAGLDRNAPMNDESLEQGQG